MTTEKYIIGLLIICLLIILNCWIEAERIVNWHYRKYMAQPRITGCPVRRRRWHRFILHLLHFPVAD